MTRNDSVVAICPGHGKTEQAVRKLQQSGFDLQRLSVVANGALTGVAETGADNIGDLIQKWGFPLGAPFLHSGHWVHSGGWAPGISHRSGAGGRCS